MILKTKSEALMASGAAQRHIQKKMNLKLAFLGGCFFLGHHWNLRPEGWAGEGTEIAGICKALNHPEIKFKA